MKELALPIGLISVIACMLLPLPSFAVDCLLVMNLIFAVLLVVSALYLKDPLKLSSLPTILLLATLYRLALNISTTRKILGTGDVGDMIEMFGHLLMQGEILVGFVVFLVLTLVQFIVIAKGSERVAEVSARFTLDALPGKQMSIDADVRSGMIDMQTARMKRESLQVESRFYGALDGAMKFIKGDAIAGLVITAVNIIGGLLVGLAVQGMSLEVAIQKYTLLTLGDGLLSQIPALLNSLAAGLVVTRVARENGESLANEVLTQLGSSRPPLVLSGAVALFLAFVGVAPIPFLLLSGVLFTSGYLADSATQPLAQEEEQLFEPRLPPLLKVHIAKNNPLSAFLQGGDLRQALMKLLTRLYDEKGLLLRVPEIDIHPSLDEGYLLIFRGISGSTLYTWSEKAQHDGEMAIEEFSETLYQYIVTHQDECVDDVFTRRILDHFEHEVPELISGTVPGVVSVTMLSTLFRALLKENISIRSLDLILQSIAEHPQYAGSERAMLEEVRIGLKRQLSKTFAPDGVLSALRIDPAIDLAFAQAERDGVAVHPEMLLAIEGYIQNKIADESTIYMLSSKGARCLLQDCLHLRGYHSISVIAEEELCTDVVISDVGCITLKEEEVEEYFEQIAA